MNLIDLHNDCLTQTKDYNSYLKECFDNGVKGVVLALFLSENKMQADEIINVVNDVKCKNNVYYAIEDVSNICYEDLDKLERIKPLYCSLTWNGKNDLAGGCNSKANLTKLGLRYVKKIEEFSFVDTAHLNKKSFYKIARITTKPILNSHTNLMCIKKHNRNINHKQIKTIIKSNGLICLTGVKEFLNDGGSLNEYIDSIYMFYKKYGSDNLGLSTDFIGSEEYPLSYSSYDDFMIIYKELKKKGLSERDLDKIFYLNALDFFSLNKNRNI